MFWRRTLAGIVDFVLCTAIWVALSAVLLGVAHAAGLSGSTLSPVPLVVAILVWWVYFAWWEASRGHATPGKRLTGLWVIDIRGDELGFGQATGRLFAKTLTWLTLGIGYLITYTGRRRSLHDSVARTDVLRAGEGKEHRRAATVIQHHQRQAKAEADLHQTKHDIAQAKAARAKAELDRQTASAEARRPYAELHLVTGETLQAIYECSRLRSDGAWIFITTKRIALMRRENTLNRSILLRDITSTQLKWDTDVVVATSAGETVLHMHKQSAHRVLQQITEGQISLRPESESETRHRG